jgi:Bacterial EndoU nuclease
MSVLGDGMSGAADRLTNLDDGTWIGDAAEAFRRTLGDQPAQFSKAGGAFGTATSTVRSYADVLRQAQSDANRAIEQYRDAEARSEAWRQAWTSHRDRVRQLEASDDPEVAARAADLTSPLPSDPGADDRDGAIQLVANARTAVDEQARATADVLSEAEEEAPDEPGFFGSIWGGITDFVGGAWDATIGGILDSVGAFLDDPGGFLSDAWDNFYDHIAFWNWDTFWRTWWADVKDLIAWEHWADGNWMRALGTIAGNLLLGVGIGKLLMRILRRRGRPDGDSDTDTDSQPAPTPEDNRNQHAPPDGAPGYDRIHRSEQTDTHVTAGEGHARGGHRAGTGYPGKTEFPPDWSDQQILDAVDQAAQNPQTPWQQQGSRYVYWGESNGVHVRVVVEGDGRIVTAFPDPPDQPGTGVYRNPSAPPAPAGGQRPVWTRDDPASGTDGHWTWETPNGPVRTDRNGNPIAEPESVPTPPSDEGGG